MLLLSSTDFSKFTFSKESFRKLSECQMVWIQIRTDIFMVFLKVKKVYEKVNFEIFTFLKQSFNESLDFCNSS